MAGSDRFHTSLLSCRNGFAYTAVNLRHGASKAEMQDADSSLRQYKLNQVQRVSHTRSQPR